MKQISNQINIIFESPNNPSMTSEEKKALLLLKAVIFHYHGLDEEEKRILEEAAANLDAQAELNWVKDFTNQDLDSSFERAREFFKSSAAQYKKETKLEFLQMVWEATHVKGFISEMEAMGMLKIAKDWGVQRELSQMVRKQ